MRKEVLIIPALSAAMAMGACASSPQFAAQRALLDDPRMKCAQSELIRKGYDVDPSYRRPGRILATRLFTAGDPYKAAITASIDTVDNSFQTWTRYIRPDQTPVPTAAPPTGRMMMDAMEVERVCEEAKS
ncbi:MAG: hypothetical protein ACO1Q7_13745 [Gemmatimonas sp.]